MTAKKIPCPRCKEETLFSPENPFRPFCSERCKMIDLGNWASGGYRVPTPEGENSENQDMTSDADTNGEES